MIFYGPLKNTMVLYMSKNHGSTIILFVECCHIYIYTMVFTQYSKVIQQILWNCHTVVSQMVILRYYTMVLLRIPWYMSKKHGTFSHYDAEWLPHLYTNVFTWYSKVIQCIPWYCYSKCSHKHGIMVPCQKTIPLEKSTVTVVTDTMVL